MSRGWLLGLLLFLAMIAGLAGLRGSLLALAIPIILLLLYAMRMAPDQLRLVAGRHLSDERVSAGTSVTVTVSISNVGRSIDELLLEDMIPPGLEITDGSPRHLIALPEQSNFEFSYSVRAPRGGYAFGPVRAIGADAFGILHVDALVPASGRLIVLPTITRVKTVSIRPRRTRVYAGTIPARVGGAGTEFFGLRQYEMGDSASRINWRALARHPEAIYSNDYQQERVADAAIVLDGRERANIGARGRSLFEYSVIAAGSIASALLRDGNRVGLLVYSHYLQWTLPGYGRIQRERILQALASALPGSSQVFEGLQHLPTRLFPPESQIILVSPVMEDDLRSIIELRARGYQVLVICPDPVAFEVAVLRDSPSKLLDSDIQLASRVVRLERAQFLRGLRRAGVQVAEWDVNQPFDLAMARTFRRIRGVGARS